MYISSDFDGVKDRSCPCD